MKRFIRYLYEYEQGKKLRNVGFVKAEQGVEDCVLHIHGKGLNLGETKVLKLYLFFVEDGECVGIWQGDAENVNPAINYRMYFTVEIPGDGRILTVSTELSWRAAMAEDLRRYGMRNSQI